MSWDPSESGVRLVDLPPANPKPLNGSQFSQGTLWDPKAIKPSPEHRYAAHGYSPERREAVRELIPNNSRTVAISSTTRGGGTFASKRESSKPGMAPGRVLRNQRTQTRNALVDIVARSSVPIEDLATNTPKFKMQGLPGSSEGRYRIHLDSRGDPRGQAIIQIDPNQTRARVEHSIVHELGHHADFESDRKNFISTHRVESRVRGGPPSLEGAAEGYAAKNLVHRTNDPTPFSTTASYSWHHRNANFQEHFQRVSGRSVGEVMGHKAEPEMYQPTLWWDDDGPDTMYVGSDPEITDDEWAELTGKKSR